MSVLWLVEGSLDTEANPSGLLRSDNVCEAFDSQRDFETLRFVEMAGLGDLTAGEQGKVKIFGLELS